MKFKVINQFRLRDTDGHPTDKYAQPGMVVDLNREEAERLIGANCLVPLKEEEIERETVIPFENQARRMRKKRG